MGIASNYEGNVHIGVVGFASDISIAPIVPLNIYNEARLKEKISEFKQSDATRYYEALHKGSMMIDSYKETLEGLSSINMVSFSDGMDNASMNTKIGGPNEYFSFMKDLIVEKGINSHVVFANGLESGSSEDINMFKGIASKDRDGVPPVL